MSVTNGVDVTALGQAVEAITEEPDVGRFTFRAETEWDGALRGVTRIDDFDQGGERIHTETFEIGGDEPEQILGERTAPNAVELLLAAIGSCLTVGYAANAAAMDIELEELRFELEGDVDLRGFLGISEEVRPGYDTVTCTVHVDTDATEEAVAELQERVERTSPLVDNVANGVTLETDLEVS
ncbi:OsmC family protein [Natronobacterium texcoconense]|uniref:Uncharacterized OsmC-related protein n=1 Tax=Natronobacterium texcoconense TaxID=1095778 RepID=A0A1H1B064_NATTX|nr:OsmC family protein [Natronobacterium texcoconense]SDQ45161.1 Uncharacterized OsmC-related protein [Natronobacterium texcoconense]